MIPPAAFSRVVFVCAGNICRSPLAEHALRRAWAGAAPPEVEITSFGLVAEPGDRPIPQTLFAAARAGLRLEEHRARRFTGSVLRPLDLVLVMEHAQRAAVLAAGALAPERVSLLGALRPGVSDEIADPECSSEDIFDACVARIVECVHALATRSGS